MQNEHKSKLRKFNVKAKVRIQLMLERVACKGGTFFYC